MPAPLPKSIINDILNAAKANPTTETLAGLGRRFNVSRGCVAHHLKENDVHLTHKRHFKASYEVNEEFFSVIDTPAKAQILGFIYADGCVCKSNSTVNITQAIQDEDYLKTINKITQHTKPLYYREIKTMVGPQTKRIYSAQIRCTLAFSRTKIHSDLQKLGVCPNKTGKNLSLPQIPNHLIKWFILGLFEGDGCITYSTRKKGGIAAEFSIVGSPTMLKQIAEYIKTNLAISFNPIKRKRGICELRYSSEQEIERIMEWLYVEHTGLRMERKYLKWLEIKQLKKKIMQSWTPRQIRGRQNASKILPPIPNQST